MLQGNNVGGPFHGVQCLPLATRCRSVATHSATAKRRRPDVPSEGREQPLLTLSGHFSAAHPQDGALTSPLSRNFLDIAT